MASRSMFQTFIFLFIVLLSQGADAQESDSANALKSAAQQTELAWQTLQDYLAEPSANKQTAKQLRKNYQQLQQQELHLLNQLVESQAQQEFDTYIKPQSLKIKSTVECQRLETKQQCTEKAVRSGLENAAKQGASYYVEARSTLHSSRVETTDNIDIEQTFSEQVDMQAGAHILRYDLLDKQFDENPVTSEREVMVRLNVLVAAKKNLQYLQQLKDKYRNQLSVYLSQKVKDDNQYQTININSIALNLMKIPAGQFVFGSLAGEKSEQPTSKQHVAGFYLSATEVTNRLYQECVNELACSSTFVTEDAPDLPVVNISFEQIQNQFLPWLNRKTGKQFRLPSELEWEYAAKFQYNVKEDICLLANVNEDSCTQVKPKVAAVAQYKSNSLGIFDLAGNVAEWTSSCWLNHHKKRVNTKSTLCDMLVVKGGSWYQPAFYARPSARIGRERKSQLDTLGFRLALSY
ncbi:MAG: SUMF1/EgtB/PvdO family nonheme iron enzyme [Gammaproteobacteria bacterium]|nr:SUMF1/EgtB/PvdO family nonheme iron enzyme [Gammaproteobacteria bacterium]